VCIESYRFSSLHHSLDGSINRDFVDFMQAGHKYFKAGDGLYSGGHLVDLVPKVEPWYERSQQCQSLRNVIVVTLTFRAVDNPESRPRAAAILGHFVSFCIKVRWRTRIRSVSYSIRGIPS